MSTKQSNVSKVNFHQKPSMVIHDLALAHFCDEINKDINDPESIRLFNKIDTKILVINSMLDYLDNLRDEDKI